MSSIASESEITTETEIQRIRQLLDLRQLNVALASAQSLLERIPNHRDALYLSAVAQRQLQQIDDALLTLQRLEAQHPRYGRLYQERGLCFVAMRNASQAVNSLLRAVNLNPALPDSWSMLEALYRLLRDEENARLAAEHVATLKTLPEEIVAATRLLHDGDLGPAEQLVRTYLRKNKNRRDIEGMVLLARIGIARGAFDDAETLLAVATAQAPDYRAARFEYVRVLVERHKYPQARDQLKSLLPLDTENPDYRVLQAAILAGLGQHEQAVKMYERLLEEMRESPDLKLSIAHALKTMGRTNSAVDYYRAATLARPNYGEAYWSLANLKTYQFSTDEILRMRTGVAAPNISDIDRWHLCFALGKALEDREDYSESFEFYTKGNALKRAASRYRPEIIENNTRLQIAVCTREFFSARSGCGVATCAPIFIVGLPRSGSTLIEQILASHSNVEGTQELADVPRIVQELQGYDPDLNRPRYPEVLQDLDFSKFRQYGERYLSDTSVFRSGKPRFIDKMPNNFRHLGLIHLMFPNAHIIDARREPMACCFGNLKQLFASGQEFTYSIDDIARYYRTYLELMEHWDSTLPGRILCVYHEDVVRDLQGSVQRILDFCGLPFEQSCVEFHRNSRSVRTASSEQVRRPIYRDGLEQWRRYEQWLDPLRTALGDALWRYRATAQHEL